ncbi:MAG: hypothetical protein LBD13_00290 [Spirochaetaceae bacterium]|jgi:hypothetical protein|nr:hypothetical protein [Spirochaetaceae bacterium]
MIDRARLMPRVLRARDFRLYTERGKRLVDLWQDGGAAVLGHTPKGALKTLKNEAARGLLSPFPHPAEGRLFKALSALFPDKAFRAYADESALCRAAAQAGFALSPPFADPSLGQRGPLCLWRPFLEDPEDAIEDTAEDTTKDTIEEAGRLLIPVLPSALAPKVLVIPRRFEAAFPPAPLLPPVILAAAARSAYALSAAGRGRFAAPQLIRAAPRWRRRGIYLSPAAPLTEEAYTAVFLQFLDAGFLLPPVKALPLILPAALSPGEAAQLNTLLRGPFP